MAEVSSSLDVPANTVDVTDDIIPRPTEKALSAPKSFFQHFFGVRK
jgi:hypothetical protein